MGFREARSIAMALPSDQPLAMMRLGSISLRVSR
jgi:hypothetical protein